MWHRTRDQKKLSDHKIKRCESEIPWQDVLAARLEDGAMIHRYKNNELTSHKA